MSRQSEIDRVRLLLISRMDLFQAWGKRSYKNTNDMKHEDTSDIIEELASYIVDNGIRSKDGFESVHLPVEGEPGYYKTTPEIQPKQYKEEHG